jgi:hypothetical protein
MPSGIRPVNYFDVENIIDVPLFGTGHNIPHMGDSQVLLCRGTIEKRAS